MLRSTPGRCTGYRPAPVRRADSRCACGHAWQVRRAAAPCAGRCARQARRPGAALGAGAPHRQGGRARATSAGAHHARHCGDTSPRATRRGAIQNARLESALAPPVPHSRAAPSRTLHWVPACAGTTGWGAVRWSAPMAGTTVGHGTRCPTPRTRKAAGPAPHPPKRFTFIIAAIRHPVPRDGAQSRAHRCLRNHLTPHRVRRPSQRCVFQSRHGHA